MAMSVRYATFNGQVVHENRNGVKRDYMPDTLGSTARSWIPVKTRRILGNTGLMARFASVPELAQLPLPTAGLGATTWTS